MTDDIERDPHPAGPERFVGRAVRFDFTGKDGVTREFHGTVEKARYNGRTPRGAIPDYLLIVRGKTGRVLEVSLVENGATFPDQT